MTSANRRQTLAAAVRRLPGYRAMHHLVLPRVRANTALTDIVWRVFRPETALGASATALHGGRHLEGPGVARLPVVGFDLLEVRPELLESAVDAIAALQRQTLAFRPVLVLAEPAFALAREHGFVVDVIASADDWWGDPAEHAAYVARRLVSVRQGFALWHLVRVGPDAVIPEADARMLTAVRDALSPWEGSPGHAVRAAARP